MARRGGGAGAVGIAVLLIAGALAVLAFTRKAEEIPGDGVPPDDGVPPGNGILDFEPVLLGTPTVRVNPF